MQRVVTRSYFTIVNIDNIIKWVFGTIIGICGAILVALNFEYSKCGYILFTISSMAWMYISIKRKDNALLFTQFVFIVIDTVGLYKWMSI